MSSSEVPEPLHAEVAAAADPLAEALAELCAAPDEDTCAEALGPCIEQLASLRDGAGMAGLAALGELCDRLGEGLRALSAATPEARAGAMDSLLDWPGAVLRYLAAPDDEGAAAAPVAVLVEACWPQPLADDDAAALVGRLMDDAGAAAPVADDTEPAPERLRQATAAAVSLRPDPAVDPVVVDAFLQDAPEHAAGLAAALAALERGAGDPAASRDTARRLAHTLKGSAAVAGIRGVAELTHHLEDILDHLAATSRLPPADLAAVLTTASDCLEAMVDALLGRDRPPADAVGVLQSVLDWAAALEAGDDAGGHAVPPAPPPSAAAGAPAPPGAAEPEAAEPEAALRVPLGTVDALFRVTGELAVEAGQLEAVTERIQGLQRSLNEQDRVVQQRLFELEDLIDVRDVTSAGLRLGAAAGGDFDPLEMDRYNALHSCSRALAEAVADWRELKFGVQEEVGRLRGLLAGQRRLKQDLERSVLATRLLAVSGLVPRLQRAVRQAARVCGREVALEIEGEELQLDADILNGLADPLLHLLRNAVDHGIEAPERRRAGGKPEQGRLRLSFAREGSLAVVRCRDDGGGLDLEAIRRQAEARGLAGDAQALSDAAAARLVLLPGFSTRAEVSQLSGRGIGLDVVNERVRRLKGRLDIHTEAGAGTEFVIRLPASLVSLHCLLVSAGDALVAVPGSDVQRVPLPASGHIQTAAGALRYVGEAGDFPVRSLAALMGRPAEAPAAGSPVLLVAGDEGDTAVAVDRLAGSRDLVLKGFGRYLPGLPGVRGGAILGDGTVTPVLDLPALLRAPALAQAGVAAPPADPALRAAGGAEVLVVDDSLSVRRALGQCLRDAGYRVRQARDGVEAVAMIAEQAPQLVIADLEMPRMNGLELTQRLRADAATRGLPILMLTSRAMDKHRRQAEMAGVDTYLTKPFQEEPLLDSVATALTG